MPGYEHIKFHRLRLDVSDEPNVATPHAKFERSDATLLYWANSPKNCANEVKFHECHTFRIGDPNDEGFYSDGIERTNESIYNRVNFPDLTFGGLYELSGSNMESIMELNLGFVCNPEFGPADHTALKHYLFFMKDATFECFAGGYSEQGLRPISALQEVEATYKNQET